LRERLTVLRVVAILIGVVGAVILTLSKSGAGSSLAGDAMIGGLILTWAFLQLGIRKLDTTYPALFVVGVFGTIGCLLLTGMGLVAGRIDGIFIPLNHFDATTIIWFDLDGASYLARWPAFAGCCAPNSQCCSCRRLNILRVYRCWSSRIDRPSR
jgi:drug/metabolite transporter (DMT)-like permease